MMKLFKRTKEKNSRLNEEFRINSLLRMLENENLLHESDEIYAEVKKSLFLNGKKDNVSD
ncbi:hypothetical protein KHU1_0967 [Bacillus amyloliquefaciens KHG19]|nr:hypothetical protein KHU1_0967 [Bacillus amyloliquefaciens KHG19]MCP1460256.1 hypothetical protein [Bacillus amyloliquefaciens]